MHILLIISAVAGIVVNTEAYDGTVNYGGERQREKPGPLTDIEKRDAEILNCGTKYRLQPKDKREMLQKLCQDIARYDFEDRNGSHEGLLKLQAALSKYNDLAKQLGLPLIH